MPEPRTQSGRRKPIKKPPVLFDRTQSILRRIEEKLGDPFVAYWNSYNGSVCDNDVVGFYEILRGLGAKPRLHLMIKSGGGDGQASLRIVHLLRQFTQELIALVPLECASAATMLALGSDEIRMGPLAHLSAVDTSLRHDLSPVDTTNRRVSVSQDELLRVVNLWRQQSGKEDANPYQALFPHVHPLVVGAVDRSSSLSIMLCKEILSYHLHDAERADALSRHLNAGYPSHDYPITIREAERVGLHVAPLDPVINDLLIELNELYSEMGQAAVTDFDEVNHHNNEILGILESRDMQVYYQNDKDWHYRVEERRWVTLNDASSWRKIQRVGSEVKASILHIR